MTNSIMQRGRKQQTNAQHQSRSSEGEDTTKPTSRPNGKNERGIRFLAKAKKWQATWTDPDGHTIRRRFPTKTLALMARDSTRTKILENRYLDKVKIKKTPIGLAVTRFLEHSQTNLSHWSYKDDLRVARYWLASPLLADKTLDQISTADIERYKQARIRDISRSSNSKTPTPVSKRLVDFEVGRLKRLFTLCMEWELCDRNPATKVKMLKADVKRVRYLTEEEETLLMAQMGTKLSQIVRFALNTGMRRGEILDLSWNEVDFSKSLITIPGSKSKGKRDRYIPLNKAALAVLRELPQNIDRYGRAFTNDAGGRHQNLHRVWRHAVVRAGVEDFRFHDLRHTFASRLVSSGVDLAVIRELLGHKDFAMTLRYAHMAPSKLTEAVAVLDSNRKESGNTAQQGVAG